MQYRIRVGESEALIEVVREGDHLTITRGEETVRVRVLRAEAHDLVLEIDPVGGSKGVPRRLIQAAGVALDSKRRQLWLEGRVISYERIPARAMAATSEAPAGDLSASIPSIVSEVLVSPGDRVVAGDKLVLLESMKMVIPIQAPFTGTVRAIHCEVGQAVDPGFILVDLEPEAQLPIAPGGVS